MALRKSVFGVLGLAGILSLAACASDNKGHANKGGQGDNELSGSIGLALTLSDGSDVNTVNYTVYRGDEAVRNGVLALNDQGVAQGVITNLTAGTGYRVVLEAPRTRLDAGAVEPCRGESATFEVLADQTVPVSVILQCDDTTPPGGNITINGTFNVCPRITSSSASPTTAAVGSSVNLTISAVDRDNDTLSYEWFTGATYAAANVFASTATASYTCTSAGTFTIVARVFDGAARGCQKFLTPTFSVTCTGGTPQVDSGTPVVDSGTPVVDSGTPVVDSGTPVVDSGTPVVDSGTPVVDSGTPVARFGGAQCESCLRESCNPHFGVEGLEYVNQCTDAACDAVFNCFQSNRCSSDQQNVFQCYCGAVAFEVCQADGFTPTGPCKGLLETGLGTTDVATVLGRMFDLSVQSGVGAQLFACGAELCGDVCQANPR